VGSEAFAQLNIAEDEQLYRIRTWRRVDLREKQNKGFFASGREVTKFIMDGINSGEITEIYRSERFLENIGKDGFLSGIVKTDAKAVSPYDALVAYDFGENVSAGGKVFTSTQTQNQGYDPTDPNNVGVFWSEVDAASLDASRFAANEFAVLEIIEDVTFDKRRSRLYYDIEAIKLIVPGDIVKNSPLGQDSEIPFAVIKYDEIEKMFRNHEEAKWVNRYNPKEWKNFADAFLLRLFSGPIVKYENPDGYTIAELFPNHADAVEEIYRYEMFLMEKEHNLWEY
jgi:gliding motility associated protien GldN